MKIKFSPQRSDDYVVITKQNDVLTINDVVIDFDKLLPEDGSLPYDDEGNEIITFESRYLATVDRKDGELTVTILLPHGPNPDLDEGWPEPIENPANGVVIDQPAVAAFKVEAEIARLVATTPIPEDLLRAAIEQGRNTFRASWSECRINRHMLAIIREWDATGVLVEVEGTTQ